MVLSEPDVLQHAPSTDTFEALTASIERGYEYYSGKNAQCKQCHGVEGRGDGDQTGLYDEWNRPKKGATPQQTAKRAGRFLLGIQELRPRDFTRGIFRGGDRPIDLYWRIYVGIKGTPIKLVIYDDEANVTKARLHAEKLITKDKALAIIGPSLTHTSMAVLEATQKAKVPLISCAAGVSITSPAKDRPWVFKTAQTDQMAVARIFEYLQKQDITKVAILTVSTGFGKSGRKQLETQAPKFGIEIVANEVFGEKDAAIDAEIVEMADFLLKRLNVTDTEILVNSVGCKLCRPPYHRELKKAAEEVKEDLCEDCQRKVDLNPLRIFDCKEKACQEKTATV